MHFENNSVNLLASGSTVITRVFFWVPTMYILNVCVQSVFSLLTLHVAFSTIGCSLLMVEAILVVCEDALLNRIFSKPTRVGLHWILHFLGLKMLIIGFMSIVILVCQERTAHFWNTHGKVGLAGVIFALVFSVVAFPKLYRTTDPEAIVSRKQSHIYFYFSMISMILLWAGQITGISTGWWIQYVYTTNLILSAYVIGGLILIAKAWYLTSPESEERQNWTQQDPILKGYMTLDSEKGSLFRHPIIVRV